MALLRKRETFPYREDGKVTLFSIEVNQEELRNRSTGSRWPKSRATVAVMERGRMAAF